jgi:hypothetical protein
MSAISRFCHWLRRTHTPADIDYDARHAFEARIQDIEARREMLALREEVITSRHHRRRDARSVHR